MEKERKQDLSGPDEEALEKHVHDMLDVTATGESGEEMTPEPLASPKSTKISVTADEVPSAPIVTPKKAVKKSVSIAITHDADEPEEPVLNTPAPAEPDTELTAAIEEANKQLAEQESAATAPLIPEEPVVPKKGKKVTITHFDEPDSTHEPEEPLPDVADEPEPSKVEEVEPEVTPEEAAEPTEVTDDETPESPLEPTIEDAITDQAVADIIASESDELIVMKDEKVSSTKPAKTKKTKKHSIFTWPFRTSAGRWLTFLIILIVGGAVGATPNYRYALLNALGVRSSASVVVLDQSTQQPLKNVTVKLAGQTTQTNDTGTAQLQKLRLGPTELRIEKRGFATETRSETVGWGSNPLTDVSLKPAGLQYTFTVTDVLSGKPIASAEATMGDATANADSKGEIKLTLDKNADLKAKLQIKAAGYREESMSLPSSTKQVVSVALTPAHKVAFISKRSGAYDLYKVDADGKNEQLVLKGTGSEQDNITLAVHPSEDVVVMISSRENKRDSEGNLLSTLTFVDLRDGKTKSVIQSPQIKAVDWIGTRFVYVQMVSNAGAEEPQRSKLMSFDYISGDNRQLAAANYFNDVVSAAGKIYYAPASAFQNGVNNGMFVVFADSSGKQSLFNQEVWNIFRTGYDKLTLAVQQDWYDYQLGGKPTKLSGQPSNTSTRVYVDSPDGKHSIWIDTRDGKGTLVVYDTATKEEKVLYAQAGLKGPVRWLNSSSVVFRVVSGKESADYAASLDGGSSKKITDVTDTKGVDRWTY